MRKLLCTAAILGLLSGCGLFRPTETFTRWQPKPWYGDVPATTGSAYNYTPPPGAIEQQQRLIRARAEEEQKYIREQAIEELKRIREALRREEWRRRLGYEPTI